MREEDCVETKRVKEDTAVDVEAPVEEETTLTEVEGASRRTPPRRELHRLWNKNQLTQLIVVIE